MKKLLLLGGGGHCKSVLDSLNHSEYSEIAICDLPEKIGQSVSGIPILCCDAELAAFFQKGYREALVTLGSTGDCMQRMTAAHRLEQVGYTLTTIVDPTAIVSREAVIGTGTFLGKGAIINAGVAIGRCCIINSGAIVEHDCQIGDFTHIAPGATLSGGVVVGENSHVGTNATILQSITIGKNCLIGAGSVVVKNVHSDCKAFGNPCREVFKY